tara:strand:- start:653 stop:997 length:345 start_codon:yes stop_codon:yes gene_type:complete
MYPLTKVYYQYKILLNWTKKLNPGIFPALLGTLILAPDALFMRLSELSGGEMVALRATQGGSIFFLIGLLQVVWPRSEVKPKVCVKAFWPLFSFKLQMFFVLHILFSWLPWRLF